MAIQYAPLKAPTVDLLALIGADTSLHREARDEYAGACPQCGGADRLHVQVGKGIWFCRRCHPKWTDAVGYLMWRDGLRYPEAVKALGGLEAMPIRPPAPTEPTPEDRAAFTQIAQQAHAHLPSARGARSWLARRGIDDAAAALWRLGLVSGKAGDKAPIADRNVWCGLTIPLWGVDGALYGIQVRRDRQPEPWDTNRDWRYAQVYGSHMPLYGQPARHPVCVLVEGALDAVLLHRIAGDLVDVAATGSDRGSVSDRWYPYLLAHTHWLIAYDRDAAGDAGAASWLASSPRSSRLAVPFGKDPSEWWALVAGEDGPDAADRDIREWIVGARS
jgi:DNA primase